MTQGPPDPRTERVLVVDDEVLLTRALCETLNDSGFDAIGCSDPREAITHVRAGGIALVLADLSMPGMNGVDLLQAVAEVDPTVVGIVMTGQGSITSAVQSMRSGALDYIQKPFKITAVLPVLQRALTVRRLRIENSALNARLRERALELEAANRDLDAFARTVSHDLRAPLTGVLGFATLLQQRYGEQLPPEALRMIDNIATAGNQMNTLIGDLLSLARFGAQAVQRSEVNLAALAVEVFAEFRQREPERSVELLLGELPRAQADPALVRQVLINLLGNAWKFTRDQPRATVRLTARSVDGQPSVYSVADNGIGFDASRAGQLFQPFKQLHERVEGSGIGLSIVKRIVQHHGGRIWADSGPGAGATFSFTLQARP